MCITQPRCSTKRQTESCTSEMQREDSHHDCTFICPHIRQKFSISVQSGSIAMLTQALLVLNILDIAFSQTCYFPDGTIALEDLPCNSSALASTCCGRSYACLSNNICEATSETVKKPGSAIFVRGSCTDSSWTSDSCPTFCVNQTSGDKGGSAGIGKCPDGDGNEYYCVDGAPSNCSAHENVFVFSGMTKLCSLAHIPA